MLRVSRHDVLPRPRPLRDGGEKTQRQRTWVMSQVRFDGGIIQARVSAAIRRRRRARFVHPRVGLAMHPSIGASFFMEIRRFQRGNQPPEGDMGKSGGATSMHKPLWTLVVCAAAVALAGPAIAKGDVAVLEILRRLLHWKRVRNALGFAPQTPH